MVATAGPGLVQGSGLVRAVRGYAALVRVTSNPRAWICRMWFFSLRSVSRRAWESLWPRSVNRAAGVGEQVPDDDQDGAGDVGEFRLGLGELPVAAGRLVIRQELNPHRPHRKAPITTISLTAVTPFPTC